VIALGPADPRYPRGLLDLREPPAPLWIDGDVSLLARRAVSIVGTRRPTPYGIRVARELARACAESGIVVISGMAQGIDSASHEGALEAGGATVAVLGAGLAAHLEGIRGRRRRLAYAIRTSGALVSEFPMELPAQKWTFPRRDGTIAAIGEIVVVVEAPIDSGALITAREARRLRRDVYAVPGPIGASASAGANELIASGRARALTGSVMLLSAFGRSAPIVAHDGDELAGRLLDALAGSPADPDALARRLGVGAGPLASLIARLLVSGEVASLPDGRVARR
jgi:DNA processing protein